MAKSNKLKITAENLIKQSNIPVLIKNYNQSPAFVSDVLEPDTVIHLAEHQRIFALGNIKDNHLSYSKQHFVDKIVKNDKGICLHMPKIIDSEWFNKNDIEKTLNGGLKGNVEHYIKPRTCLTVQIKSWGKSNEKIFTSPFLHNYLKENNLPIRHEVLKSPLVFIDFMNSLGIPVKVRRIDRSDTDKKEKLAKIPNSLIIPIYWYFGIADLGFIANDDDYKKDIKSFYGKKKGRTLTFDKHLSTQYINDDINYEIPLKTNWIVNLNGTDFVVYLKSHDLNAMLGNRSLDSAYQIAGVEQKKEKDLIRDYEKSDMLSVYVNKPYEFDKYASIGDLQLDKLVDKTTDLSDLFYEDFSINYLHEDYKKPSKTIGSDVVRKFQAVLTDEIIGSDCQKIKQINLEYLTGLKESTSLKNLSYKQYKQVQNNIFDVLTKDASANNLLNYINQDTTFLLAKVQAGRCRNNKPSFFYSANLSCDVDISGCYNRAMSIMEYPLGSPIIFKCKTNTIKEKIISSEKVKINKNTIKKIKYRSVKNQPVISLETLINYFHLDDPVKCELVDNLWSFNITTIEPLTYHQTLINSVYDITYEKYKSRNKDVKSKQGDLDFNSGTVAILGHEIINGVITSQLLKTLKENNSAKIYKDFIRKVGVTEGIFYPKSLKCENVDQVIEKRIKKEKRCNKKKQRDFDINIEGIQILNENDCHNWCSYNLGKLIIDKLRFFRNKYEKSTPENEFYKLISNTIYGDLVSNHFITSNVVVANNITGTVRAFMWEKENTIFLNGSITDGDVFFFNEVLYPTKDNYFNTSKLYTADYLTNDILQGNNICQKKPLMNIIYDEKENVMIINNNKYDNKKDLDKIVLERINQHMREVLPNSSLLNKKYKVLDESIKDKMVYKEIKGLFELEIKSYNNFYARKSSSDYVLKNIELKKDLTEKCKKIDVEINKNNKFLKDENFNKESILNHNKILITNKKNLNKKYSSKIRSHKTNQRIDGFLKTKHTPVELITNLNTKELIKNITIVHNYKKIDLKDKKKEKLYKKALKNLKNTKFKTIDKYDKIAPATEYLLGLQNPENVLYPTPCVSSEILKINKINNDPKYKNTTLMAGDDIYRKIIVHPHSPTQYIFSFKEQRDCWIKSDNSCKNKNGLGLSGYFINKNGTINVKKMNTTFRKWIEDGVKNPLQKLQKNKIKNINNPQIQTVINTSMALTLILSEVVQDDYWLENDDDYFDFNN
jgi:hypothetical protein